MTYQDILAAARTCSGPYCKVCPVCNGRACKNTMPGPGSKGTGTVAARNYDAWQEICLNMDTICENGPVDTRFTLFGQTYDLPVFAGPVGAVKLHYGDRFTDQEYNEILVPACVNAGIAAFTGDGTDPNVFAAAARAIGANGGKGIPTVKPWDRDTLFAKLDQALHDHVVAGAYTGDGTKERFMALDFTPRAVLILPQYGKIYNNYYYFGGLAVPDSPVQYNSHINFSIVEGGFEVSTNSYGSSTTTVITTNSNGKIYHYLAVR